MRVFGLDPGKVPTVCVIDDNYFNFNIWHCKDKDNFPHENFNRSLWQVNLSHSDFVICEIPHSVFGASAKSNFTFGYSVGSTIQSLYSYTDSVNLVRPKEWQKLVWQPQDKVKGNTKVTSFNAAKRILGNQWKDEDFIPPRGRVVNHNYVDAFLIAYYGYLINQ